MIPLYQRPWRSAEAWAKKASEGMETAFDQARLNWDTNGLHAAYLNWRAAMRTADAEYTKIKNELPD